MSSPSSSPAADTESAHREGVVTRSTGSWYDVRSGDAVIPSRVRGKFRLADTDVTNPVAVGDRVTIRVSDNEDERTGLITEIHDRQNKLSRRAAGHRSGREHVIVANVDRAWAVQSVRLPRLNTGFVDRFFVSADMHDIPAGLVINKADLMDADDRTRVMDVQNMYADLGYPVIVTSAAEGFGIERFRDALAGQVNVVAGPSGAGKSSLLNAIEPGLDVTTGEVSQKTSKGTHTTTHAELYPLSFGGYVVDTPGIREFGIQQMHPADLAHFFFEFIPYLDDCKFQDCTHDHEPGCAVKHAAERFAIHPRRYDSYLSILHSLQDDEG
jgi:ribosome biogenesis GTPase